MSDLRPGTPAVTGRAFARAALLGNPSDGFGGKTLGLTFAELAAAVTLRPGDGEASADADARRLVDATVARFERHATVELPPIAATIETEIPREVGLGGSSAIVTATLRALGAFASAGLDPATIAAIALAVETDDLGIAAGPQDRLIQAHEGLLYLDFSELAEGRCERLDPSSLPRLFIAWCPDASEPSSRVHADLRRRHEQGDRETRATLARIAELAEDGHKCLAEGDHATFGSLMAENVAARAHLVELDPRHLRMIELADELGAPANYAGSGGAIVGIVPERTPLGELQEAFAAEGCEVSAATPAGHGFSA